MKKLALVLLDGSWSMNGQQGRVTETVTAYCRKVGREAPDAQLIVARFCGDAPFEILYHGKTDEFGELQGYYVRGGTPLYDAVGRMITLGRTLSKPGDRVSVLIDTDGEENQSTK